MRNFVQASAVCLPFRDKAFDWVFAFHVLEHLDEPLLMLREMRRVSKVGVLIRVPYRMFCGNNRVVHKSSFVSSWFRKVFPNDFVRTEIHLLLGHYSRIFFELEARVEWRKL